MKNNLATKKNFSRWKELLARWDSHGPSSDFEKVYIWLKARHDEFGSLLTKHQTILFGKLRTEFGKPEIGPDKSDWHAEIQSTYRTTGRPTQAARRHMANSDRKQRIKEIKAEKHFIKGKPVTARKKYNELKRLADKGGLDAEQTELFDHLQEAYGRKANDKPRTEEFNCFDTDQDDADADSYKTQKKFKSTTFDKTDYGAGTFVDSESGKKEKASRKTAANDDCEPLEDYKNATLEQRIGLLARTYEPTGFDTGMITYGDRKGQEDQRPQWTPKPADPMWKPPAAVNDNRKQNGKHDFPALDEARNNTLMRGRNKADTLTKNEWAFDILIEIKELLDAAAPKCAWLQHNGHGETDEHVMEDNANPGYGVDAKHDYGPSVKKIKGLWEYGNEPSKNGEPWNLGTVDIVDVTSEPSNKKVKALHYVGGLKINARNHVIGFRDKKGNYLKFQTKTRGAKGGSTKTRAAKGQHPKAQPDPADIRHYDGAALPRNKKGELRAGFVAGKIGLKEAGASHSSNDPWVAWVAADRARAEAASKLSEYRSLVSDLPYDALTQAASGFRIGELCDGRLGNTTDSARARNLLQFAIERIVEERSRTLWLSKRAA